MIDYTLVYKVCSSIRVQVLKDGTVEVRAPLHCPRRRVDEVVQANAEWILTRQRMMRAQHAELEQPPAALRVLGERLPVEHWDKADVCFRLAEHRALVPSGLSLQELQPALTQCYRKLARAMLPGRVQALAASFGLHYERVNVTSAARRWGSCSTSGSLNFSWRLMMASPQAIDAVIIHELMHIKQPNHSPAFRQLERENTPDYEACKRELDELAHALQREGWM